MDFSQYLTIFFEISLCMDFTKIFAQKWTCPWIPFSANSWIASHTAALSHLYQVLKEGPGSLTDLYMRSFNKQSLKACSVSWSCSSKTINLQGNKYTWFIDQAWLIGFLHKAICFLSSSVSFSSLAGICVPLGSSGIWSQHLNMNLIKSWAIFLILSDTLGDGKFVAREGESEESECMSLPFFVFFFSKLFSFSSLNLLAC